MPFANFTKNSFRNKNPKKRVLYEYINLFYRGERKKTRARVEYIWDEGVVGGEYGKADPGYELLRWKPWGFIKRPTLNYLR